MADILKMASRLSQNDLESAIDSLTQDQLYAVAQTSVNWMTGTSSPGVDEDGFALTSGDYGLDGSLKNFTKLQKACWDKFVENPQINSHVRDVQGCLTGYGFNTESDIDEVQDFVEEIEDDPRNNLHVRMGQYVARSEIEGELFLSLTLHETGFVEIDFLDPSLICSGGSSTNGIYFHENKSHFPLAYRFEKPNNDGTSKETIFLPSINLAYFPEMKAHAEKLIRKDTSKGLYGKSSHRKYKDIGGMKTFVVEWDRGFLTVRNSSYLKTTLIWLNHYESLKRWEIDHKKSAGSYLWVAKITDDKAYRTWLKLTKEQKEDTGLFAKKVPGGTIVLPPGIDLECKNPNLSSISGQDTDIMHMVTSGLNRPEDMVTGASSSTSKSGISATRGVQSDRTQDQIANFERFLQYHFWRGILHLAASAGKIKSEYKVKEAVNFKDQEPVFKDKTKPAYKLISFEFPQSEISDLESKSRALLGVKHGPVSESLGIPHSAIAKRLGFGSYKKRRLAHSTEEEIYPKTQLAIAIDAAEESAQSQEPSNVPGNKTEGQVDRKVGTVDPKKPEAPNDPKKTEDPKEKEKPALKRRK